MEHISPMPDISSKPLYSHAPKLCSALILLLLLLGILFGQASLLLACSSSQAVPNAIQIQEPEDVELDLASAGAVSDADQEIGASLLTNIPQTNRAPGLLVLNYQEDAAIREAILVGETRWQEDRHTKKLRYRASNGLQVYTGHPDAPIRADAQRTDLHQRRESTLLTARILLGLWNSRRYDPRFSVNGRVVIRINEILAWRGVQKHHRIAYPGSSKRFTDGYQWKHKQQVYRDLEVLSQYYLRGQHTIVAQGKVQHIAIDAPYLEITPLQGTTTLGRKNAGYLVAPGNWIDTYEASGNVFLSYVDRRIFQLNPQYDGIALRIALYLTEHWRQHARSTSSQGPLLMADLLTASMVPIDKPNLTSRFVPRVEAALRKLYELGILGEAPVCLSPVDTARAQWGKDWLASYWRLIPPVEIVQSAITGSASAKIRGTYFPTAIG